MLSKHEEKGKSTKNLHLTIASLREPSPVDRGLIRSFFSFVRSYITKSKIDFNLKIIFERQGTSGETFYPFVCNLVSVAL